MATCRRGEETKKRKKRKSQTVIFHACAETPHAARSLPYLEVKVGSPAQLRTPSFMAIGSGVLLPGVAENPTFPILRALVYTTGLGDRPTCDYKRPHVSRRLRNAAVLSEKLPILSAPLRFVSLYAVNARENS